jgi:lycopene beta-cyclase
VSSSPSITCDIAIVGGGLAGSLIVLALAKKRPELDIRIIEASPSFGGNHLWSFFDSDVASDHRWLIEPLICYRWDAYDIIFPGHARTIDAQYNSIESERLDRQVRNTIGSDKIITAKVAEAEPGRLVFCDGRTLVARHVIDARGPGDIDTLEVGWQKFVGQALKVPGGHGLTRPIVMDASVEQIDGYRFVYCLPFDAETIFVEDTYYSDGSELDAQAVRDRIGAYAKAKGWTVAPSNAREEHGVLPVVIGGNFDAYWASSGMGVAKAGLRSGMFHATTGYSLPDAVRLAVQMPELVDLSPNAFATEIRKIAKGHWRSGWFYRMLDAMLFYGSAPPLRYKVLERFYRLSPGLIARFYAGQSTLYDKARILSGKPPIPIGRAAAILIRQAFKGFRS